MSLECVLPPKGDTLKETEDEDIQSVAEPTENSEVNPDLEEGELEDGELDDDEPIESQLSTATEPTPLIEAGFSHGDVNEDTRLAEGSPVKGSEEESDDDEGKSRKKDKRKKRKKRRRDDKEKHDKKKRKKPRYVDHDNVEEEYAQGRGENVGWVGYNSPPGPYDSPRDGSDPYEEYYGSPGKHGSRGYQGDPSPAHYDSNYDSPPGPYDSPSDEDGPPRSKKRKKRQTLSDMIGGEEYMDDIDAAVAASEQSDHFRKGPSASKMKKREKSRRY